MRSGNCWGSVLRVDLELASGDLLQLARYATRDRLLAQVPGMHSLLYCQCAPGAGVLEALFPVLPGIGGVARTQPI